MLYACPVTLLSVMVTAVSGGCSAAVVVVGVALFVSSKSKVRDTLGAGFPDDSDAARFRLWSGGNVSSDIVVGLEPVVLGSCEECGDKFSIVASSLPRSGTSRVCCRARLASSPPTSRNCTAHRCVKDSSNLVRSSFAMEALCKVQTTLSARRLHQIVGTPLIGGMSSTCLNPAMQPASRQFPRCNPQ